MRTDAFKEKIDANNLPAHTRRMAKKSGANGRADLPVGQDARQRVPTKAQKPSALLDTRVIYCGDNLKQLAQMAPARC
jgi:hypothetical protein